MVLDIVRWWLVVQLIGLVALPLTFWLFRRLPDRGYSFSKPFGLLLIGWGAWLLSMLGLGALGTGQLILVALFVGVGGIALLKRSGLRELTIQLRRRAAWIVFSEAVFVLALGLGLWLRWHDFWNGGVAIAHTEMPMDLTFLSGILASTSFPPQDPWLANYPINYYYLGYLLIAVLIRLSGVTVGVGYTLGIATVFALAFVGIAGLVRNLIEASQAAGTPSDQLADQIESPTHHATRSTRYSALNRWLFPLLAPMLVLLVGNQVGGLQVLAGSEKIVAANPAQWPAIIANGLGARNTIQLDAPFPVGPGKFDDAQLTPADKVTDFNTWWPSRAAWDDLPDDQVGVRREYNITEFPLFSFLLGDLHPHVLSLPWTLLAVALSLNVLLRQAAPDHRSRGGWINIVLSGIILGGLYAINSWDLPTYLLLYLGALALLYFRLAPSPRQFFWAHWTQQAGIVVVASYFVYLPFHMSFAAPTEGFPLGIAPARTGLLAFAMIFGLFFVPLLAFVIRARPTTQAPTTRSGAPILIALGLIGLLLLGIVVGWSLFVLLPLAVITLWIAYTRRDQPALAFALWTFALGALVIWGTDVVYLRDNFDGVFPRMNTIFKFFYQVWLLWGTIAAFALWVLVQRLRWRSLAWIVPFGVLLVGALYYPALAPADTADRSTIDGLAYIERSAPGEAAAIDWVRANTPPNAIIAQAPGNSYREDTARVASATGRPTVIGWSQSHEGLWRRGQPDVADQIGQRVQDMTTLYTTTDPQLVQSLLERYAIDYVYVGPAEQRLVAEQEAPPEALIKFDQIMPRVFEHDGAVIYQHQR